MQNTKQPNNITRKLVYSIVFFVVGILLVTFGFWKTVLVALITGIGFFLGSSDNIESSIKGLINKLFPPSDKKVSYTSEDLDKLKKALEKKEIEKKGSDKSDKKEDSKQESKQKSDS